MIKSLIPSGRQTYYSGGFGGGVGNGHHGISSGDGYSIGLGNGYGGGRSYGIKHAGAAGVYAGYSNLRGGGRGTPYPTMQDGENLKPMLFAWRP